MERWNLPTETGKIHAFMVISTKQPAHNSGYKKWREKCKIHVYFPQEILS